MVTKPIEQRPVFDLGHRGDVDYTQIAKLLAMTPMQRLRRFQRWRQFLKGMSPMYPILDEVIKRLTEGQVEYVIVGGVSGILQGAPIDTFDLDICYHRTPANIARLAVALSPLNPRPRGFPADLPFAFDERTIQSGSNFTLSIGEDDLDLLGDMSAIGGYEQIIGQTSEMLLAGFPVKVLSLAHLIATKQAAGRPKDLAALPVLRATLELQQKQESPRHEPPTGS